MNTTIMADVTTTLVDLVTTQLIGTMDNSTEFTNITEVAKKKKLTVVPVVMLFLFGTVGNLTAIFVLFYTAKKHKWRTFYRLVAALAVSDLIGLAGPLPISMANYANKQKWMGGQPLCDFMSFTLIIAGMASAMLACTMSLDRFMAVWYPHYYNTKLTKRKVNLMMLGLVLTAFLIACLPLFGVNANVKQFPGTWCFFHIFATEPKDRFFAFFYACMGISMILIMLTCNTMVIVVLARRCQGGGGRRGSIASSKSNKSKLNDIYNMVFLVVLMTVFTICWVPLCIRILINQTSNLEPDRKADLLVMRLSLVNQILDPWIYILLRKDMIKRVIQFGKKHTKSGSFFNKIAEDEDNTGATSTGVSSTDSPSGTLNRDKISVNGKPHIKYSPVTYPKKSGPV